MLQKQINYNICFSRSKAHFGRYKKSYLQWQIIVYGYMECYIMVIWNGYMECNTKHFYQGARPIKLNGAYIWADTQNETQITMGTKRYKMQDVRIRVAVGLVGCKPRIHAHGNIHLTTHNFWIFSNGGSSCTQSNHHGSSWACAYVRVRMHASTGICYRVLNNLLLPLTRDNSHLSYLSIADIRLNF